MKTVIETPILQAKTSTGKPKFWQGRVVTDGAGFFLQSESWQGVGAGESKHVVSVPSAVEPKNVGKANETQPLVQARTELASKLKGKVDKGYTVAQADGGPTEDQRNVNLLLSKTEKQELRNIVDMANARAAAKSDFPLPMLAHKLADKMDRLRFPVFVQPKFDGVRCLYDSAKGAPWSRGGNQFIPRVFAHLAFDTRGLTLDGELLLPREYGFQDSIRAVKKFDASLSPKLLYVVYDIVETDGRRTFEERLAELKRLFAAGGLPANVRLCPTELAADPDAITEAHSRFVADTYEGIIIRSRGGKYAAGHRSAELLKHKDFTDDEFLITGFGEGSGKDAGLVIWTCRTKAGVSFTARPRGTVAQRERLFQQAASYVGRYLTVRYQGVSEGGVPRFPVGIAVRDYE